MLNDEICKLREKLNESIISGQDYMITYKLSIELDELIAKYYRKDKRMMNNKKKVVYRQKETLQICRVFYNVVAPFGRPNRVWQKQIFEKILQFYNIL